MDRSIYVLGGNGGLSDFSAAIERNASLAVKKIGKKISIVNIDIIFYDNPAGVIPELGIGGYSPNAHTSFISLDPKFRDFDKTVNVQIERILAHELHHCLRWASVGYGETLVEALVTEGLADHFEIEVTGRNPQPWDTALDEDQIEKYSRLAKKSFDQKNYGHHAWFYGSKEKQIPRWTGYSLGFRLVGKYLQKNPSKKPSGIYDVEAKEFL